MAIDITQLKVRDDITVGVGSNTWTVSDSTPDQLKFINGGTAVLPKVPAETKTIAFEEDVQSAITLTASSAVISDTEGKLAASAVTSTELGYVSGVTSAIQTQLGATVKTSGDQTIAGTKTFSSTISGSISGNAGTATTLQIGRTINVGTGVSGTATSFNGSENIVIPINGVSEAYLTWGGKNIPGNYAPIDAAIVDELGSNRLAFYPDNKILVEYSQDGGSTWLDYEATPSEKINLFNGVGAVLRIGKNSLTGVDYSNYRVRVTISDTMGSLYTSLNKFIVLISTSGSGGTWATIEGRLQSNIEASIDTWDVFSNQVQISGWAGYNVINTSNITTYGNSNNKSSQYGQLRFSFGCTTANQTYSGLYISKIFGFGGVGWSTPSNLARSGNIYSYNHLQDVTFPGTVTGTRLISTIATGTSPLAVTSTTAVSNLNSDYLDGQHGSYYTTADNLSGTIPSAVLGNSTHYIGTTAVTLNRASTTLALTGVTNTNWDSAYTATNSATSANTPSTIVKRGTSGEFSAGAISGTAFNVGTGSPTWTIDDAASNTLTFKLGGVSKFTIGTSSSGTSGDFNAGDIEAASLYSISTIYAEGSIETESYISAQGNITGSLLTGGLAYSTTAPTANNTNGLKIYVGSTDPATKYSGWLYIIT